MKLVVLTVVALAAAVLAAPADQAQKGQVIDILRSDFQQQPNGGYQYSYETANGIQQTETGEPKTVNDEENKPHEVVVMRGSYSYIDNEGKSHTVTYVADENGFQPLSDDIPVAPVQA